MIVNLKVPHRDCENGIYIYESLGYNLLSRRTIDRDTIELEFEGKTNTVPNIDAETYLQFADGTRSRLFIRRDILSDD